MCCLINDYQIEAPVSYFLLHYGDTIIIGYYILCSFLWMQLAVLNSIINYKTLVLKKHLMS